MMISIQSYVRQGRHTLRKWALDPRLHFFGQAVAHFLAGFILSGASLAHSALPLAMGLVCACTGWPAVLVALGSGCGYLLFWGSAGHQGLLWAGAALAVSVIPGPRLDRPIRLLIPAMAALIISASGVIFQIWLADTTSIPIYILRVLLGVASTALFTRVTRERNPIFDWLTCGVAVLALAQIAPIPELSFGVLAAGVLATAGAFPAAALSGLALDLAQITPVPMTAVLCASYLIRFLERCPKWLRCAAPAGACLLVMSLCGQWDFSPIPALLIGGTAGAFLPIPGKVSHRRGETGTAQVRLEMAASVLAQTEQLLLEATAVPVDEAALVARAAERACGSCPYRKACKDTRRLGQLPPLILHKPLLTSEELPLVCRKSGRFLAELHRSQEQLRSIRADRERQREYRAAVIQQYQFMAGYLQELSDQLSRRIESVTAEFSPEVRIYGNRPEADNGDRCLRFAGTACRYYVLLCDGMGTGLGAIQEAKIAGNLLRRLLSAGFPADHALRSLNSLCALRDRAGAVTMDLAEICLDSGKVLLYKWGAAPSWLVSRHGIEKIGTAGPPPGLSVTDYRETTDRLFLRRGETLVLVSDGVPEEALNSMKPDQSPGEMATALLSGEKQTGEDDATVVTIRLFPGSAST